MAVCAAFGLDRLLLALRDRRLAKVGLTLTLTLILLFEFWNGPYPMVPAGVNPFFEQLADEGHVLRLDRQPGQRDERWVELLTGSPE